MFDICRSRTQDEDILLLLANSFLFGRMICEAVLKSGKLNFHNESSWSQSFEFVYTLLPSIDYKVDHKHQW